MQFFILAVLGLALNAWCIHLGTKKDHAHREEIARLHAEMGTERAQHTHQISVLLEQVDSLVRTSLMNAGLHYVQPQPQETISELPDGFEWQYSEDGLERIAVRTASEE